MADYAAGLSNDDIVSIQSINFDLEKNAADYGLIECSDFLCSNSSARFMQSRPAIGSNIKEVKRLRKFYGIGRWRKLKGNAQVQLSNGRLRRAEVHWNEANGIGKKEMKIKRFLD